MVGCLANKFRIVALATLTVVCAAFLLAPDALAGTLDQQQTDAGGLALAIASSQSVAQTFTAGVSGGVDQVDLDLDRTAGTTAYLSVEIRDVSGGVPGGMVLASHSVPASGVSMSPGFVSVNFAPAAPVVAGTRYAIVAYSATAPVNQYGWLASAAANPYPGGEVSASATSPPSGAWISGGIHDQAFKTYVVPATAPGPATTIPTGQRAAALKKCKRKHTAKARRKCKRKANRLPL